MRVSLSLTMLAAVALVTGCSGGSAPKQGSDTASEPPVVVTSPPPAVGTSRSERDVSAPCAWITASDAQALLGAKGVTCTVRAVLSPHEAVWMIGTQTEQIGGRASIELDITRAGDFVHGETFSATTSQQDLQAEFDAEKTTTGFVALPMLGKDAYAATSPGLVQEASMSVGGSRVDVILTTTAISRQQALSEATRLSKSLHAIADTP